METIKELTRSRAISWHTESIAIGGSPACETGKPKRLGVVKKILTEDKFGFITDSEGTDWFFHFNFLLNPGQWEALAEGTRVGFAVGTNSKGPCAVDVYRA